VVKVVCWCSTTSSISMHYSNNDVILHYCNRKLNIYFEHIDQQLIFDLWTTLIFVISIRSQERRQGAKYILNI